MGCIVKHFVWKIHPEHEYLLSNTNWVENLFFPFLFFSVYIRVTAAGVHTDVNNNL